MATWKLSNNEKKRVEEHTFWSKGDVTIKNIQCYRWGSWTCESSKKPNIDLENENGIDLYSTDYEWELVSFDDGCWAEWDWGDLKDDKERKRIEALFENELGEGMHQDGWFDDYTEAWIFGELLLEKVEE
ncbi:MAG: hypothetical protein R3F27_11340 [Gammaproteobacteria bacterium]